MGFGVGITNSELTGKEEVSGSDFDRGGRVDDQCWILNSGFGVDDKCSVGWEMLATWNLC